MPCVQQCTERTAGDTAIAHKSRLEGVSFGGARLLQIAPKLD